MAKNDDIEAEFLDDVDDPTVSIIEFTVPPVQQGVPIQPNWSNEKG